MFGASHSFGSQTQHTAFLQIYSSHLGSKSLMSPIQIPCWEKIILDDEILCNIWIDKVPWRSLAIGHKEDLNELAAKHWCSWRGLSLDVTCVPLARLGRVSTPSLAFLTARHYVGGCQIILEHPVGGVCLDWFRLYPKWTSTGPYGCCAALLVILNILEVMDEFTLV